MPREIKATLEFGDGIYVSHVWFAGDGRSDWFAALLKFPGDDFFTFRYRFRYYKSKSDVNDDTEKSNTYFVEKNGEEDQIVRDIDWMIETVLAHGFRRESFETEKVVIQNTDSDAILLTLRDKHWLHGKQPNAPGGEA